MVGMWYMWLSKRECEELGRAAYLTWEIEIFLPSPTITWFGPMNVVDEVNLE